MMGPNKQNALADLALKEAKINLTPLQMGKLQSDIENGKLKAEFQRLENSFIKQGGNKNDQSWYRDLKKSMRHLINLYKGSMNADEDYSGLGQIWD